MNYEELKRFAIEADRRGDKEAAMAAMKQMKTMSASPQKTEPTSVPSALAEFSSAANRSILGMADVLPKGINEGLGLLGVDARLPTFSGAASSIGVGKEGFMEPGLARDVVQAAGETAPAAVAAGAGMRQVARMAPNQLTSLLGGGSAGRDFSAGLLAGAGGEVGESVGQSVGGDVGGAVGRNVGGLLAPMLSAVPKPSPPKKRPEAPSIQQLKRASDALYRQIDDLGVTIKPEAMNNLAAKVLERAKSSGLDSGVTPKGYALVNRVMRDARAPKTVSEVETLRKLASGISTSMDKTEANVGRAIASTIDDFFDDIAIDTFSGQAKRAGPMLQQARSLVQRRKKTELLQQAFEDAMNQASGFENGLRTQFRSIVKRINAGRLKGWTAEEKAALEKVVRGGPIENALKFLGKFGLNEGQATSMFGSAIGIGGGAAIAGVPGAVAMPLAGQAAKYGAQAMTRGNATNAANLTALGPRAQIPPGLLGPSVPPEELLAPAIRAGLLNMGGQ